VITYTGDVWKVVAYVRLQDGLEVVTVDADMGIAVIRRRLNSHRLPIDIEYKLLDSPLEALSYSDFSEKRNDILRLVSLKEFRSWLDTESL